MPVSNPASSIMAHGRLNKMSFLQAVMWLPTRTSRGTSSRLMKSLSSTLSPSWSPFFTPGVCLNFNKLWYLDIKIPASLEIWWWRPWGGRRWRLRRLCSTTRATWRSLRGTQCQSQSLCLRYLYNCNNWRSIFIYSNCRYLNTDSCFKLKLKLSIPLGDHRSKQLGKSGICKGALHGQVLFCQQLINKLIAVKHGLKTSKKRIHRL